MSRSRQRRIKRSTQSGVKQPSENKTTKKDNKVSHTPQTGRLSFQLWRGWQIFWSVIGPINLVIGAYYLFQPKITIETAGILDSSQPLSAQFKVKNTGNIPVRNVTFSCSFGFPLRVHDLTISGSDIAPVASLAPGAAVTRSCATSGVNADSPNVEITAYYEWPVIGKNDSQAGYFRIVKGAGSGVFLLPDIRP